MGLADDIYRHNQAAKAAEVEAAAHRNGHVGPSGTADRSCFLCRNAERLAKYEAAVAAGKLIRG